MNLESHERRARTAAAACLLTLLGTSAARADDTEIFVNKASAAGMRPNILFIIDNSGSMDGTIATGKAPYVSTRTYAGSCVADRVYWRRGPGAPPACNTADFVPRAVNSCNAARLALDGAAGLWTGKAAEWNADRLRWVALDTISADVHVECQTDRNVHGQSGASNEPAYARNGSAVPWSSNATEEINWNSAHVYTFYSANWLNWLHAGPDGSSVTRLATVKAAAATILNSMDGVNVGLMTFNDNTEGGRVTNAIGDITANRQDLVTRLNAIGADVGGTPLAETLYEAGQYLAGRPVDYGRTVSGSQTTYLSAPESRRIDAPDQYRSPIQFQCQRNFIILLTDGEPTSDSAQSRITALPGYQTATGLAPPNCDGTGDGRCLDEMAEYLNKTDLATATALHGVQNAITYTIGFGPEVSGSARLSEVAAAGGGKSFAANDVIGLTNALQDIVSDISERSSTFTTPTVSVNAFNRTQTTNELYISVFEPTDTARWPGNLKKYALLDGRIVDADGQDAIDPGTGFFNDDARSFWTVGTPDGRRVQAGGAASLLPDPSVRKVYTFIDALDERDLTAAVNSFTTANTGLDDALLGTSSAEPTRTQVIDWARGVDLRDVDGDGSTSDHRRSMGDPLHAHPVLVAYGADPGEEIVFTPTNDGYLHATAAESGEELWSFIPSELLGRLKDLYVDSGVADRTYGLDGDISVLRFDVDQDGEIERADGDRLFIYFGMRRGGHSYYALDVTDPVRPRILWRAGVTATAGADPLPGIGETWSTPSLARVDVDGSGAAQNSEKIVLIFGGGYDEAQEDFEFATDTSGHRIYMVDAVTGKLLWYGGGPGGAGSPDLELAHMTNSIPARVSVIDTDGNGFADRMYTADTGGRVWRFDIRNGESRSTLVAGGVFADLGAARDSTPAMVDTRRFYYAPDVAFVQRRGAPPYYNLAIGSGYRGHPLHTDTRNSFYSLRDTAPFARFTQAEYDDRSESPLTEAQLADITSSISSSSVPRDGSGWKLDLELNGRGEKVLAEAVTVSGTILFTSYEPQSADSDNPCVPANGINRVYALQVDSGRPAIDFNDDAAITDADAWARLSQTGIAGEVSFALERGGGGSGGGDDEGGGDDGPGGRDSLGRRALCLVGVEVLQKCVGPGDVVRTFWQRTNTN